MSTSRRSSHPGLCSILSKPSRGPLSRSTRLRLLKLFPLIKHNVERVTASQVFKSYKVVREFGSEVAKEAVCTGHVGLRLQLRHHPQSLFHSFPLIWRDRAFALEHPVNDLGYLARREYLPLYANGRRVFRKGRRAREDICSADVFLKEIEAIEQIPFELRSASIDHLINGELERELRAIGTLIDKCD